MISDHAINLTFNPHCSDGVRVSSSTKIEHLLLEKFRLTINNASHEVDPPEQIGRYPSECFLSHGRITLAGFYQTEPRLNTSKRWTTWGTWLRGFTTIWTWISIAWPRNKSISENWRSSSRSWNPWRRFVDFFSYISCRRDVNAIPKLLSNLQIQSLKLE